jgi:hypothetical protein
MTKNPAAVSLGRRGGKIGGKVKSEAKAAAVRENGKLGGRPMCTCQTCPACKKRYKASVIHLGSVVAEDDNDLNLPL